MMCCADEVDNLISAVVKIEQTRDDMAFAKKQEEYLYNQGKADGIRLALNLAKNWKSKLLVLMLAFTVRLSADTGFSDTIQVREVDGSPSCQAGQIKFSNGSVTCSGGVATVTSGGGGGSLPLPGGGTNYVQVGPTSTQTGAFNISSGTVGGYFTVKGDSLGNSPVFSFVDNDPGLNEPRMDFIDNGNYNGSFGTSNADPLRFAWYGKGTASTIGSVIMTLGLSTGTLHVVYGIVASTYTGNGAALTNLTGSNISTGQIASTVLPSTISYMPANEEISGSKTLTSSLTVVESGSSANFEMRRINSNSATSGGQLRLTQKASAAPASETRIGAIVFGGAIGSGGTLREGAYIKAVATGSYTSLSFPTKVIVGVSSVAAIVDMMTITGDGVGIGTGTPSAMLNVRPSGDLGVAIGATPGETNAGVMFDVSNSTSNGVVIFNNQGQTVGSANSMMTFISTNTTYAGYFMRFFRNDSNSNGDIRWDAPNPNLEFVETDSGCADGNCKFEIGINDGISYWATRNGANDSFERLVNFGAVKDGGYVSLFSTAAIRFQDMQGSYIGFRAPDLSASWVHDLWATSSNTGKLLIQTSDGGSRPLAWSNTFGVATSSLTTEAPMRFRSWATFASSVAIHAAPGSAYAFSISTSAAGPFILAISTGGAGSVNFQDQASSPTLSSCGTGPSIVGNNNIFTITPGATAGGCTATFTPGTFIKTPVCTVSQQTLSLVNALSYTVTATAITFTETSLTSKLDVHCFGRD